MKHEDDQHDMLDDLFISEKFESIDELMQLSSLKDEYDSSADLLENFTFSASTEGKRSHVGKSQIEEDRDEITKRAKKWVESKN